MRSRGSEFQVSLIGLNVCIVDRCSQICLDFMSRLADTRNDLQRTLKKFRYNIICITQIDNSRCFWSQKKRIFFQYLEFKLNTQAEFLFTTLKLYRAI